MVRLASQLTIAQGPLGVGGSKAANISQEAQTTIDCGHLFVS